MKIKIRTFKLLFMSLIMTFSISYSAMKTERGEGLYITEDPNVAGSGNIWASFNATGFLWDTDENSQQPEKYAFPEIKAICGIKNLSEIYIASRFLSYGWKFDWASIGTKFTFGNNKKLTMNKFGIKAEYKYRFLKEFHSSIAGFQDSKGTGFVPEGFIVRGNIITLMGLYSFDVIAKRSTLPLKLFANIGTRIFANSNYYNYSQYLIRTGISLGGLGWSVFAEYSLDAFLNRSTEPKKFSFDWNWGSTKTWEVAFSENPMYLTLGGKIRYENGAVISMAIPFLLSFNRGSDITYKSPNKIHTDFPDEAARGINDAFDPWFAKWKIVLAISYPFRYKQTSSELKRTFLIMKNKKKNKRIDLESQMNSEGDTKKQDTKRLEEIRNRQKKLEESGQ